VGPPWRHAPTPCAPLPPFGFLSLPAPSLTAAFPFFFPRAGPPLSRILRSFFPRPYRPPPFLEKPSGQLGRLVPSRAPRSVPTRATPFFVISRPTAGGISSGSGGPSLSASVARWRLAGRDALEPPPLMTFLPFYRSSPGTGSNAAAHVIFGPKRCPIGPFLVLP